MGFTTGLGLAACSGGNREHNQNRERAERRQNSARLMAIGPEG